MNHKPYLLIMLAVLGCRTGSDPVKQSLQKAGANKHELEKVLSFYSRKSGDSLKLKAAIFLICNMEGKFSYKGSELEQFWKLCDSVSGCAVTPTAYRQVFEAFDEKNGSLVGRPERVEDLESMSSDYLIQNIEEAFKSWDEAPWKDEISFEDFCEYVLPYRIGNETYENFRSSFCKEYKSIDLDHRDMRAAADSILGRTNKKGMFLAKFPDFVPSFPVSVLQKLKGGSCVESSSLAIYIMRSLGLAVAQDFTPQWPHRSGGHTWGALVINKDSCIDFEGVNADKVGGHLLINTGNKVAKIFRRTYSLQPGSLALIHGDEEVPELFLDPCIKDVSSCYYHGVDVRIGIDRNLAKGKKFTYICVFDNANWAPVFWAAAGDGEAIYSGMGKSIVYLPAVYDNGKYKAIGSPVKVDSTGLVKAIVPDMNKLITLKLKRKYPIFDWWDSRTLAMRGGRFQASNKADFSDAVTVYTIKSAPEMNYQAFDVSLKSRYKYWRYLPVDSSYGDIAEIQFFDEHHIEQIGQPIGTQDCDPANGVKAAFDHDPLSFFQGSTSNGNWVGMCFDSPKRIETIRFLCRNDDNFINVSDIYELFYWDKGEWRSLRTRVGDSSQAVVFDRVPADALYLLHDRSRGKEERIFTYENDKQVWW